ncbi:MAG: hypothetical protein GTO51_10610 [Candidatus Latescibacteria bacterium]|nr:hypothetical protein [Candidatus Latescibacterota bacterium]NIM66417.1 hypothetical protein [Candidatus Latescibacterota bacterium]NIO02896.1 hypothetical protein [Candidatus Latescibacterota bacterium]NIO30031.1 hypothetical protein [Candidatus Latescibacterota bacterium]NIO57646.1 hypothetical protein [Candidatus Latescibacterota bacterium]
MNRANKILLPSILIAVLYGTNIHTAASQVTISLQSDYPVHQEKTRILVVSEDGTPVIGAVVRATYRPGSRVSTESEIGMTDDAGSVDWIPQSAGIVTLSATRTAGDSGEFSVTKTVSVKFASTPAGGILIMILAGILLIGGSVYRFTRYLWGGEF